MAVGLRRLIITYFHSNSSSIITSKITTKVIQENCRRAQIVKVISIKWVKKLKFQYFQERRSDYRKNEICRFNDRSILPEAEKTAELAAEKLKVKMEIERAKAGVNIMEGEKQIFGEMANR